MDPREGTINSTPKKAQKKLQKLKKTESKTRPEDILSTFQNHKLAPEEWETLADQLLPRRIQKAANEIVLRKKTKEKWGREI